MRSLLELLDRRDVHLAALGVSALFALVVFVLSGSQAEAPEPRAVSTAVASAPDTPTAAAPAVLGATATPDALGTPGRNLRIVNTQGRGVLVRNACLDSALGGGGWGEGAIVTVVRPGEPDCGDWVQVRLGTATSWVRVTYLEPAP